MIVSIREEMQAVALSGKNIDEAIDIIASYAKGIVIDKKQKNELMETVEEIDNFGKGRIEIMVRAGSMKPEERSAHEEQWQQDISKLRAVANNCVLTGVYENRGGAVR